LFDIHQTAKCCKHKLRGLIRNILRYVHFFESWNTLGKQTAIRKNQLTLTTYLPLSHMLCRMLHTKIVKKFKNGAKQRRYSNL